MRLILYRTARLVIPCIFLLSCTFLRGAAQAQRIAPSSNSSSNTPAETLWGEHSLPKQQEQQPNEGDSKICLMVYQLADNNLEYFLRQDNAELIHSEAIRKRELVTWVYFDGRNLLGSQQHDIIEPLEDVWVEDGSVLVDTKEQGSRYLRFDHDLNKMVVDTTLVGEQDGDQPETVSNFVTHALLDCTSRGTDDYVMIFSSHGGGFLGFGGDDHVSLRRRRQRRRTTRDLLEESLQVMQPNHSIVAALKTALQAVPGAPSRLDVIGFDSCLMMALGVLDEFDSSIAQYMLASEATEPAHGWAYEPLTNVDSALDLAREMYKLFLNEPQGSHHRTPKTLAIVDTAKFEVFRQAFEDLSEELQRLLESGTESNFHAALERARVEAIAFESSVDLQPMERSAVDIGSFLEKIDERCGPTETSQLHAKLSTARSTYRDMYVVQGVGYTTPPATGMHVLFPSRWDYKKHKSFFDLILFESDIYATKESPQWLAFLKAFLNSDTPQGMGGVTCTEQVVSSIQPQYPGQMLLNPQLLDTPTSLVAQSDIAVTTDMVLAEYGFDLTPTLEERRTLLVSGEPGSTGLDHLQNSPLAKKRYSSSAAGRLGRGATIRQRQPYDRRLQQKGDYFWLFGGSMFGTHDGPSFRAEWDERIFLIGDDEGTPTEMYVEDLGYGLRVSPVVYFPNQITEIPSSQAAARDMGGFVSSLYFGVDVNGNVATEVSLLVGGSHEVPKHAGGSIVPLLWVEARIDGEFYNLILGGFGDVILQWDDDHVITLYRKPAKLHFDAFGDNVDHALVSLLAFDFDTTNDDAHIWNVNASMLDDTTWPPASPVPSASPPPATLPTLSTDESSNARKILHRTLLFLLCLGWLGHYIISFI